MFKRSSPQRDSARHVAENGQLLGDFRLVELLGAGGMGEVWRAENARVRRIVRAIKVIRPHLAENTDFRKRFLREAEILDLLQHPNIVRVDNVSDQDGRLFMVMELLTGTPVGDLLAGPDRRLAIEKTTRIVYEAALGVAFAHKNGVIHRDLKPGNLFITAAGTVKVLDFGIARGGDTERVTATGAAQPATPAYLAPEVVQGRVPTPASDVYALGITLFELLTGSPPFMAETGTPPEQAAMSLLYQHVHRPMPDVRQLRPDVPEELARVLAVATAKDPADRYAHAGALAKQLEPLASQPLAPAESAEAEAQPGSRLEDQASDAEAATTPAAVHQESSATPFPHRARGAPATSERGREADSQAASLPFSPLDRVMQLRRQRNQILLGASLLALLVAGILLAPGLHKNVPAAPPSPQVKQQEIETHPGMAQPEKQVVVAHEEATPPAAVPAEPCPRGQTRTSGTSAHCCWPGQTWSGDRAACIGRPSACPPGAIPDDNQCEDLDFISVPGGELRGKLAGKRAVVKDFETMRKNVTVALYEKCVSAGACTEPRVEEYLRSFYSAVVRFCEDTQGADECHKHMKEWEDGVRKRLPRAACNWQTLDRENYPINCIDWQQSEAFCRWAGGRLPTEKELFFETKAGLADGSDGVWQWTAEKTHHTAIASLIPSWRYTISPEVLLGKNPDLKDQKGKYYENALESMAYGMEDTKASSLKVGARCVR
jgi:serine/threonine-protein kinase